MNKKMMMLSVCTALVGTMSAGAVNLPQNLPAACSASACVALRGMAANAATCLTAENGCNSTILSYIKGATAVKGAACTTTKPSAGTTTGTTKPSAGTTTDTTTKPSAGTTTGTTKPSAGTTTDTTTKPSAGTTADASQEAAIVRLVNDERAQNGLSALTLDANMSAAARVRAGEIRQSFAHTRPDGTSFSTALTQAGVTYRAAGENIAYGQKDATAVMNSWMNSSGHRANILGAQYGRIGVAAVNNGGTIYWVQLFAN